MESVAAVWLAVVANPSLA